MQCKIAELRQGNIQDQGQCTESQAGSADSPCRQPPVHCPPGNNQSLRDIVLYRMKFAEKTSRLMTHESLQQGRNRSRELNLSPNEPILVSTGMAHSFHKSSAREFTQISGIHLHLHQSLQHLQHAAALLANVMFAQTCKARLCQTQDGLSSRACLNLLEQHLSW